VDALVAATVKRFGRVDGAVNAAGIEGQRALRLSAHSRVKWTYGMASSLWDLR